MESDIIVEGFQSSTAMYGLKYLRLVGDGDSSVHKQLLETRPYGNTLVEKIECKNHLLRNLCKKLREIHGRSRSKSKILPVSPMLRNLVFRSIRRFRTCITKAAKYRIAEKVPENQKIEKMRFDLRNILSHVFGEHKDCDHLSYFNCSRKGEEENMVPTMKHCGLYEDLEICMNRIIFHAPSLVRNMDNNQAEHYNSIVAKFVGGKRVNFALRDSYQTRCQAASIAFNTEGDYYRVLNKSFTDKSPSGMTKKYVEKVQRNLQTQRGRASRKLFNTKKQPALPDEHYGNVERSEENLQPDMPETQFNEKK